MKNMTVEEWFFLAENADLLHLVDKFKNRPWHRVFAYDEDALQKLFELDPVDAYDLYHALQRVDKSLHRGGDGGGKMDRAQLARLFLAEGCKGYINGEGDRQPQLLLYPELSAIPVHDVSEYEWVQLLELNYVEIRNEFLNACGNKHLFYDMNVVDEGGRWESLMLIEQGAVHENKMKLFPLTQELLSTIPLLIGCNVGYGYFSVVKPNTVITPHCGLSNMKLRFQLPLIVPKDGIKLFVHDEVVVYEEGKAIVFDDSFRHSVEFDGSIAEEEQMNDYRVVLLFDFWHPDLREEEIEALKKALPPRVFS